MSTKRDFFKTHHRVITWTGMYVFIMWAVLNWLFNFDMFSSAHWIKMQTVQLHGFPGLVLGLLILAAVPLYIATTVVIARSGKFPIKIPLPKCFEPEPAPVEQKTEPTEPEPENLPLPPGAPLEMRENFNRARRNIATLAKQQSVFNRPMVTKSVEKEKTLTNNDLQTVYANTPQQNKPATKISPQTEKKPVNDTPNSTLPLPTDFDFEEDDDSTSTSSGFVPVFSDINFDDDNKNKPDTTPEKPTTELFKRIQKSDKNATESGNLIISNGFAVASHTDSEFWVADEIDWFASGATKPSPIAELMRAKTEQNLKPILYLGATNIMDLDKLIPTWESDGIIVVTDLDKLIGVVGG